MCAFFELDGVHDDFFGAQHVRGAHGSERVRSDADLIFLGGKHDCARSAHSERVSASRFWVGNPGARLQGPWRGKCRGRAPAGGPGGGCPRKILDLHHVYIPYKR